MENLIFSLNATVPVFAMIILGMLFKKIGIIDDVFELFAFFFKVDFHKEFLDSLCTHTHFEVFSVVLFEKFSVLFVADDLVFVEFADFARIENDEGHEVNDLFEFLR